jgi:hypothetical protein
VPPITLTGERLASPHWNKVGIVVKNLLRVVLFPWLFWTIFGWLTEFIRLKLNLFGRLAKGCFGFLRLVLFVGLGLPVTVLFTCEALIYGNEVIIGEVHTSGIKDNGQYWWYTGDVLPLPGEKVPPIRPVDKKNEAAYHRYLVELHAPVLIQRLGYRPDWDIPVSLQIDGNDDPRDNKKNAARIRPLKPVVYGEVTAVTKDSYYLTYCMYHLRDYDHPVREQLTGWSYHDGDNEGFMIRIDRKTMRVVQGEGWFHNRFYLASRGEDSRGNEPVQGEIFLEDGTRPVIYVQTFGHGVRFAQRYDLAAIESSAKIFRYRAGRAPAYPEIDRNVQVCNYDIEPFDIWYRYARGPIDSKKGFYEREITIGRNAKGEKLSVGRYVATYDNNKSSWVRPKPPWSWDDGWDRVPVAVWHFFPAIAFEKHFGTPLSDDYAYNAPITRIFHENPNDLQKRLSVKGARRGGAKWGGSLRMRNRYSRKSYMRAANMYFKKYVNRLFHALG